MAAVAMDCGNYGAEHDDLGRTNGSCDRSPRRFSPRSDRSRSGSRSRSPSQDSRRTGDSQRSQTPRSDDSRPRTGTPRSQAFVNGGSRDGDRISLPSTSGSDDKRHVAVASTWSNGSQTRHVSVLPPADGRMLSRQEAAFLTSQHRYSQNVANADVLISRYGVQPKRVVNVTPLLGRPISDPRQKGKSDLQLAGSHLLSFSSSTGALPRAGGPSNVGVDAPVISRALSVAELRKISFAPKVHRIPPPRREVPMVLEPVDAETPQKKPLKSKYKRRMHLRKPSRRPSQEPSAPSVSAAETTVCDDGSDSEAGSDSPNEATGQGVGLGDSTGGSHNQPGGKKHELNPFKDYDEEGQRLQLERRWLMEHSWYMDLRVKIIAHDGIKTKLELQAKDPVEIYEESVYHGNYSQQVKANMALKAEIRRLRCESEGGSSPSCSIAEAKKTLRNTLPHFKKQLLTGTQNFASESGGGKRSDRNAPSATVKLLKSMQKDLVKSMEKVDEKAPPPPPPPKEDPLLSLKNLSFGFGK
eukprot:TRINITY_DN5789_c0_g2_i1.p1 TRINITY_DN5789_c0_g2~~TRINITY_DN5789_c0_g2_i1.p1  ORF type:complete len:544 (-),score=86.16 TRINITY_DN5789_c0_g2_i1:27-1604(-)